MKTLAPTTGILQTAIQSGMSHVDAVSEFVDNSFGPSAGDASEMMIVDTKDGTIFMDQGNGVSDINLLFRLGDGKSRASSTDIGRFGVGSKFGALTFGTNVTVMTVHEGKFHKFNVDWGKVLNSGKWPNAYDSEGASISKAPKAIRNGGTVIIVRDLHKGRPRPADKTYIKKLGIRFMPALLTGKNIKVYRAASISAAQESKFLSEINIKDEFSKFLKSKVKRLEKHTITVNGKKAECEFGEISDGDSTLTGVHITYGGRVIKTMDKIGQDRIPSKLFGRVDLSPSWKSCLSYNKTEITEDAEALDAAIAVAAKEIMGRLRSEEQSKLTEKLGAEISNMIDSRFGKMLKMDNEGDNDFDEGSDVEALDEGDDEFTPEGEENDGDDGKNSSKVDKNPKNGDKAQRKGSFEFKLKANKYGKNSWVSRANLIDGKVVVCEVELNTDYDIVDRAMKGNPGNKPAVMILCVKALADYMADNEEWLRRMFPKDSYDSVISESGQSRSVRVYDAIMAMVRFDKEMPTQEES